MAPQVDSLKLRMFVLVSAASVLVTSAIPSLASRNFDGNVNAIFDLANKVNQTFITVRAVFLFVLHFLQLALSGERRMKPFFSVTLQKIFVEDVSHLTEGNNKCEVRPAFEC